MNGFERHIYLTSIGWKDGDKELSEDEIQNGRNAALVAKQAAKQVVLDRLGITADEAKLLLS